MAANCAQAKVDAARVSVSLDFLKGLLSMAVSKKPK